MKNISLALFLSWSLLLFGCSKPSEQATAQIINQEGKPIGNVKITENNDGLKMELQAQHLPPGPHAFHIHELGKCTAPDFKSAGSHFNPTGKQHGHLNPKGSHLGDLQNIEVQQDGTVSTTQTVENLTLKPGESNSLFKPGGTSFVIHEKMDDGQTDPTGGAGKRIACGQIVKVQKK